MSGLAVAVPVATVWTSPDAPRRLDAAATADCPDMARWARSLSAADRLGLHGRTLTQALLGEPVEVVEELTDWVRVVLPWQPSRQDPRGYPGWLRRAHLAPPPEATDARAAVTRSQARADTGTGPMVLSYGTCLPLVGSHGARIQLTVPGGGQVRLNRADVDTTGGTEGDPSEVLASARHFVGLPYLWGGTSGWGLDCSGFVHLVNRRFGRRVPRDAADQQADLSPVDPGCAAPGDLYFFGPVRERVTHVGFVTNDPGTAPAMLHAPEGAGDDPIEDRPLADSRTMSLLAAAHLPSKGSAREDGRG